MPYPTTTCGPRCCFPLPKRNRSFPVSPNFLLLNAKSKSWSRTDEICPRDRHVKFKNNTSGRERLWDTALKCLCPGLFITSPDHLVVIIRENRLPDVTRFKKCCKIRTSTHQSPIKGTILNHPLFLFNSNWRQLHWLVETVWVQCDLWRRNTDINKNLHQSPAC